MTALDPWTTLKVKGKDSFNSSFPELLNMFLIVWSVALIIIFRAHLFSAFVNLSEKVKFLPTDTHTQVSVSGIRNVKFCEKPCKHTKWITLSYRAFEWPEINIILFKYITFSSFMNHWYYFFRRAFVKTWCPWQSKFVCKA